MGFHKFYNGKSLSKMDDDWGYPYFRKPPYLRMARIQGPIMLIYQRVLLQMISQVLVTAIEKVNHPLSLC